MYSLPDALCQLFGVQRLDETAIHADPMAGLGALVGGLCRHGEDGDGGGVGPVEGADGPGRLEAVHHRHHHIHEDGLIPARRTGGKALHGFPAVPCLVHRCALTGELELGHLHVDVVVLHQQDVHPVQPPVVGGFGLGLCGGVLVQQEGQLDGEGSPLPRLALGRDAAAHLADQLLDDGHPEAGTPVLGAGVGGLLGKGLEQLVLHEIPAHADAGVRDAELVPHGGAVAG